LFVTAAGNGGLDGVGDDNDSKPTYPANYDTTAGAGYDAVISVAAIRADGGLASFSNYGAVTVDLAAPGVNIASTLPYNRYGAFSGTSMATPHVTGAVALYASKCPQTEPAEIRQAILEATTPTPSLGGKTATGGRLSLANLVDGPCR
jgi:subtilisin family serine protease